MAGRLTEGGRIDRQQPLRFRFNGQGYSGFAGDSLASALLAASKGPLARSFKYHRPRGLMGLGAEEPNVLVQLETGGRSTPNLRASQIPLYQDLNARSVNCWPGPGFDVGALIEPFSRLMPPGFYYKTFMWPGALWPLYERVIRSRTGLGTVPEVPDPESYDHLHAHCDVLVVGGGPAGLAAALAAGRLGARVVLADEQTEFGGTLLGSNQIIDGAPAMDWVAKAVEDLEKRDEVTLLPRTTAAAFSDHNYITLLEERGPETSPGRTRQRLWRLRARQVVLATGAIERPLVFADNDRPGIMLALAAQGYLNRYAVRPGERAVVFTNNDSAYAAALDLAAADVNVSVVEARPEPTGELPQRARQSGIEILDGSVVVASRGRRRLRGVEVRKLADGGVGDRSTNLDCDLLAVSGGWSPAVHLHCHAGGRLTWRPEQACFVPATTPQSSRAAGSANGTFGLAGCLAEGRNAGTDAAAEAGFLRRGRTPRAPQADDTADEALQPLWQVPAPPGSKAKAFVDIQYDVSADDIRLAAREGYRSVEHMKRYTTAGMGTDQGKTAGINALAILADALGKEVPEVGTTTFRPPYTPLSYGALAGRRIGKFADVIRRTPMHHWHESAAARFEDVGQWKRPWYYPRAGEDMRAAVNRECLAARQAVAILDATTLGKIDIKGRDAAELLDRVYCNTWKSLAPGRCRYGLMLGDDGMVMDDGVTARLGDEHYLMSTTSGNAAHVLGWLEEWLQTEWPELQVHLTSVTEHWAVAAVSGPLARRLLGELAPDLDLDAQAFPFMAVQSATVAGIPARIFRISFTGELSFEINVPASHGMGLWTALMTAGEKYGITPFGTEAMHVLRAEKGYVIVGQDTDGTVTPQDLGLGAMVALKKPDFIGRRSLHRADTTRPDRKQLVGLLPENPEEVLPEGAQIVAELRDRPPMAMIGHVTSSYYSANLGRSFALALVASGRDRMGQTVHLPLPGHVARADVTDSIFIDREGSRLRG
ncbi:MAG: sarcosine oxidase subunit alpha family protein [Alphaproteobacteria bacterium]|jgi:sarcosine oxidase subunit alpha|nr:sarcosine oxidase subunit alpha [Rhodospirillaceae bacterium]MDP6406197.1 sarcosine oxidase subunit alpha family protein [Alphaproteobacteria bacterium]MDP6621107.1 sarcosine oxidase subunit alpha family protein [Alphaproteobacteria bacterium]